MTGASHANVISERILQPLGLNATYYRNEPGYPRPPGLVNAYQDLAGDGRLVNVSDLAVHYTGMFIGYAGLLASLGRLRRLHRGAARRPGGRGGIPCRDEGDARNPPGYGLGLHFIQTPYGPGIGHGGGDVGVTERGAALPRCRRDARAAHKRRKQRHHRGDVQPPLGRGKRGRAEQPVSGAAPEGRSRRGGSAAGLGFTLLREGVI